MADPDNPTQAELDAMSDACSAPREWLSLEGSELRFIPIMEEEFASGANPPDYETAACVLTQIRQSGLTKFGFVGNERYVTPDEGQ
ncbi:MAG: hypothetical protein JY451_13995 [Erythrobacter sp.]|nr:MAG: hypothetical protein JY451_13995 [Erythrobacter sp.]